MKNINYNIAIILTYITLVVPAYTRDVDIEIVETAPTQTRETARGKARGYALASPASYTRDVDIETKD